MTTFLEILDMLHQVQREPTKIYYDNISTIKLTKDPVLRRKSKHIDVRYHFLRDLVQDGVMELVFCHSVQT